MNKGAGGSCPFVVAGNKCSSATQSVVNISQHPSLQLRWLRLLYRPQLSPESPQKLPHRVS